ncbi:hypothetical protein Tco_1440250 [Tanacetum coccineum]
MAELPNIPCPKECEIVGQLLVDHALSYALTATVDVLVVYIQQFWKSVKQVPNHIETYGFMVDKQEITYTVDIFRFIDKQNKNVIQCRRFTKLIIADIMEKFESIPKRLKEDYHSIKDDTPLVSVYTTRNVIVRGMLIVDDLLTDAIRDNQAYKDYKGVFEEQLLKEDVEKIVEGEDEESNGIKFLILYSLMKKILVIDNTIAEEVTVSVTPTTATSSQRRSKLISKRYTHIPGALKRMCRRQGFMLQQMEKKYITNRHFQGIKEKVDEDLHDIVLKITSNATNDLIEDNLPRIVANAVKKERESSQVVVPTLISQEFVAHAPKIIEELFRIHMQNTVLNVHHITSASTATTTFDLQQQLYLKVKSDLQAQVIVHDHDDHYGDDAPLEGEKNMKRKKTISKSSKSARGSSSKQPVKDTNTSASGQQQKQQDWDAWVDVLVIDKD